MNLIRKIKILNYRLTLMRMRINDNPPGSVDWDNVTDKPSTFPPDSHNHDASYSALGHNHDGSYSALGHNHAGTYESANANIQTHIGSGHAPANAQKNSDILKAEIEAVLTGVITSHSHSGGSTDIKQTEVDFGSVPIKMKRFTITDAGVGPTNQIIASLSYDDPSDGETDSAEWFENLTVMAKAGTGEFFLYCSSLWADTNGKVKINYIIGSLVFVALHYISFLCLLKDT